MSKKTSERKKLIGKLDREFSIFIRKRDVKNGCISCGKKIEFNNCDCGHFHSRRYFSTRWNELNCNAQCIRCNRFEEGNKYKYGINLIKKIGKDKFNELETLKNETKKYTELELKELIEYYKNENKRNKD